MHHRYVCDYLLSHVCIYLPFNMFRCAYAFSITLHIFLVIYYFMFSTYWVSFTLDLYVWHTYLWHENLGKHIVHFFKWQCTITCTGDSISCMVQILFCIYILLNKECIDAGKHNFNKCIVHVILF